ncbi:MAG: WD40 repeat domain-containing protein [Planctomycetaceae bacterium]
MEATAPKLCAFTKDGKLVVALADGRLCLWGAKLESYRSLSQTGPKSPTSLAIRGSVVAIGGRQPALFDLRTGARRKIPGTNAFVSRCLFDQSGDHLLLVQANGTVRSKDRVLVKGFESPFVSVSATAKDKHGRIATGFSNGVIKVDGELLQPKESSNGVSAVLFLNDNGGSLITGHQWGELHKLYQGRIVRSYESSATITSLCSYRGFVMAASGKQLLILDSNMDLLASRRLTSNILSASTDPTRSRVAVACGDRKVRVLDLERKEHTKGEKRRHAVVFGKVVELL